MNASVQNSEPILSLQDGQTLLTLYEAMLGAARVHDWDRLGELERQSKSICESPTPRPTSPRTAEELVELSNLLTRIQHLDHKIRNHLEPAHAEARQLLVTEVKVHAVRTAYGVDGGGGGSFRGPDS
jgi:hypothetical protein